jgi:hypothetical protein
MSRRRSDALYHHFCLGVSPLPLRQTAQSVLRITKRQWHLKQAKELTATR